MRHHRHGENRFGDKLPFGQGRPKVNGTNGAHPVGMSVRTIPLGQPGSEEDDEPVDIVSVQADDELINALSFGMSVMSTGGSDPDGADDRVSAVLAAWKAEVDADPVPELVDTDRAVATVLAARRPNGRVRRLAPVAAAAALLVITAGGVSMGSYSAQPQDVLWPVAKVLYSQRTDSVEAAARVEQRITRAKQAIAAGQPAVAEQELKAAAAELTVVRPEEGGVELAAVQDFLVAKAGETPPGVPTDPGAPLSTDKARKVPAGAAFSTPARATEPPAPPSTSSVRTESGSTAPTSQNSNTDPQPAPVDPRVARVLPPPAGSPVAPPESSAPAPASAEPKPDGPGVEGKESTSSPSTESSDVPLPPPPDGTGPAADEQPPAVLDTVPEIANSLGATAADTSTTAPPPTS